MAIDQLARKRLRDLADGDIARIGGLPSIGESWAYLAKTAQADLAKGSSRAVKAVKAALIRDPKSFADDLTLYWSGFLTSVANILGEDDPIAYRVQLAAREIGPTAAAALVACVAALNVEDSKVVSERLDELTALSDHPLPDDSTEDDDAAANDDSADPRMNFDNAQPVSMNAAEAHAGGSVEDLLGRTGELRASADGLADLLLEAAADVRAGRPIQLDGSKVDAWSDSVRTLLKETHSTAAAADLADLEAGLQSVLNQRASRQSAAVDALKHVEYLTSSGLQAVVPDALRTLGFKSLEEVQHLAGLGAEPETDRMPQADLDARPEPDELNEPETANNADDAAATEVAIDGSPTPSDDAVPDLTASTDAGAAGASADVDTMDSPSPRYGAELRPVEAGGIEHSDEVGTELGDREVSPAPKIVTATTASANDIDAQAVLSVDENVSPSHASDDDTDSAAAAAVSVDVSAELTEHVRAGRFGAAWFIAQAAGLPDLDANAYRLASAAFHSGPGGLDPSEVLIGVTTAASDGDEFSCQSARVALAATLRASLAAGWSPRSELESIANQANLGTGWRPLIDATIAAGDRGYRHLHDISDRGALSIDQLHEKARAIRDELSSTRIRFARADKVLRYLLRSTEPIGAALEAILAPTTGDERRRHLAAVLAQVENSDTVIETVDVIVSTAQQRQHPIESHARNKLRRAIENTADCVSEALNAAVVSASDNRAAVTDEAHHGLVAAAKELASGDDDTGPGDAAMNLLVQWIQTPAVPSPVTGEKQALIAESLPIVSGARDQIGLPDPSSYELQDVIAELRTPLPAQKLFDIYLVRGDLQEAEAAGRHLPDATNRLAAERAAWEKQLIREVRAVRSELARTYADAPEQGADAEAQLVTPSGYTGDRFDLQISNLFKLRGDLTLQRNRIAESLRSRSTSEVSDPGDRDRIGALINSEDFVGANELLALARNGSLPGTDVGNSPAGAHVFDAFTAALATLELSPGSSIQDLVENFADGDLTDITAHGDLERLRNWDNLIQRRAHHSNRQGTIASVLRALGLDIRGEASRQTKPGVKHLELFRVRATPLDGSLVPRLGSQAAEYMVATTDNHKLLRETLTSGFPTKMGPNIVLFDGVLSLDQRRQHLAVCREKKISAIVVDHAVAAFVATRHPRSFRAVQQITLPFTCFTHYTVVAGNVPDEVFVGRSDEIAQLTDRAGSLFVYGGRQLGKSALLRKIQRDFNSVPDQHAIFIDLNSHGIGSWADAQRLWPVLYSELTKIEGLSAKSNPNIRNHEPVIRVMREWLEGKESRRLLLLLDEADAFLEKESNESSAGFRNIGPLKGLFDDTEGRFKPVFAGLHKVQRLQNVANTPLAHGGRDVLIGPLAAKPAYNLVLKPMEALGYRFDNPEAVWRLLAFTNLQPGLIQVVCNDLVAHLQARPLRKGEPLISISDSDIDTVTSDERTRNKIAEKLRLTIALEDRYRVIALTVAIMSMQDSFHEKYTAVDIRINCEAGWQQGFEDLNSAQFEVYLDELIGLGVLVKDRDNLYSVRSPNIVTMLGTLPELEAELSENREQFELPLEYNPKSTRRQVLVDGAPVRSPLSEHDLSQIVPVRTKYDSHDFVVTGSDALGIHDVARMLESVGGDRGIDVTACDATKIDVVAELSAFKWSGGGTSAPRMLVIDASRADSQQSAVVSDAVHSLGPRGFGHLVVVFGTNGLSAATRLRVNPEKSFRLTKWSGDSIRSRHDNPFNTPADRLELLRYSGGWPELVERAVSEVANSGVSSGEEWDRLSAYPDSVSSAAKFLDSVGVSQDLRPLLTQWAELGSTSYERIADVAAVLDRDVDDMADVSSKLASLGVLNEDNGDYLIDPVVVRAVQRSA